MNAHQVKALANHARYAADELAAILAHRELLEANGIELSDTENAMQQLNCALSDLGEVQ